MATNPYDLSWNTAGNAGYGSGITGTTITTTGMGTVVGPGYYQVPYQPPTVSPAQQIMLYITPITNGFLLGEYGGLRNDSKHCKDYAELSEAIIALLVLKKLTQDK